MSIRVSSKVTSNGGFNKWMNEHVRRESSVLLETGFFSQDNYPDGKSLPKVAMWQEYGTTKPGKNGKIQMIPPRPFMRPVVAKNTRAYIESIAKLFIRSKSNLKMVMEVIGEDYRSEIMQQILLTDTPPLSPFTIEKKSKVSSMHPFISKTPERPLEDSHWMLHHVRSVVNKLRD